MIAVATACSFFDPLDQTGLRVTLSPPDTALYVNASLKARGLMVNRYGDKYPSDHLRYAGLDPSVSVSPDGIIIGVAHGRARVLVTRGDLVDTGWVSVVPGGTLALSKTSNQSTVDIVNTDGSGLMSLAPAGQGGGGAPAWLPGNAGLVYQYANPGGAGSTGLFVTDFAGHTTLLVTAGRDPRASRDGTWVYFGKDGEIARVHVDGSGLERVSFGGDYYPDPSPDGTNLAFIKIRSPDGRFQLAVRDLASGTDRLLGVVGRFPRWAPSGDLIAYWSADNILSSTGAVFVIGADGTGARQVSAVGRGYLQEGLDWSPNGQWLLARSLGSLDLIQVATGLTLPLGYTSAYSRASWRW